MKIWTLMALLLVATAARASSRVERRTNQALDVVQVQDVTSPQSVSIQVEYTTSATPPNAVAVTSEVSVANDTIDRPANGFYAGLAVLYTPGSGKTITGLTAETTYYAVPSDADHFKLAASTALALAGTTIDLTAVSASGSYSFKPRALLTRGGTGFRWEGSNDGSTFYDLTSSAVSSVTYSSGGGQLWSFASYPYAYLRAAFTGTAFGGIDYVFTTNGGR